MKIIINTDLQQSEVFNILSKCEFKDDVATIFTENNGKHYVISSAKANDTMSIFIAINPNQQKFKQEKFDFSEVSEWLYKEKQLKLGRNILFKVLRGYGILNHDNSPAKKIDKKYLFSEVVTSYDADKISSYPVTFATEEGLVFIYNSLIDKSIKNWYIVL